MITRVSLKGARAVLVPIVMQGRVFRPVGMMITGHYDRSGAIDGIKGQDANADFLVDYFFEKLQREEFAISEDYFGGPFRGREDGVSELIYYFERNINDGPLVELDGQRVCFSLISDAIWRSLTRSKTSVVDSEKKSFKELFPGDLVRDKLYKTYGRNISTQVKDMAIVCQFVASRKIPWVPAENSGQHSAAEMRSFVKQARRKFKNWPPILAGLDDYELEVSDRLTDE